MFESDGHDPARDGLLEQLAAEVRSAAPPADLQAGVDARVNAALAARRRRAPVAWAAGLAAILAVIVLVATPGGEAVVFADVVNALRTVESVGARGWVRGADGERVPYVLWAAGGGDVRAEYGPDSARTTVVVTGDRRLVRTPAGRWLARTGERPRSSLDEAMRNVFAGYDDPGTWSRHAESRKQDLGDVERFTYRGVGLAGRPSRLRHVLDVDKRTRLPLRAEVHELHDGRWWPVSELSYGDYNVPLPASLFTVEAEAAAMTEADETARWFALGVGSESLQVPAVLVPDGGVDVRWLGDEEEGFASIGSGASNRFHAGVGAWTFWHMPLGEVMRSIARMPVMGDGSTRRPVSAEIRAIAALPWHERAQAVLARTSVAAAETTFTEQVTRLVVTQDGRPVPPSTERFPGQTVRADTNGYRFFFARQPLSHVVRQVVGNSDHAGLEGEYEIVFAGGEEAPAGVFDTLVDVEFADPDNGWRSHLEILGERVGIRWRVETITRERRAIRLTAIAE